MTTITIERSYDVTESKMRDRFLLIIPGENDEKLLTII